VTVGLSDKCVPIRTLGSYETLLSRKAPGRESVALSHGCAVILSSWVDMETLQGAVASVIERHPALGAYIARGAANDKRLSWYACDEDAPSLAGRVVTRTRQVDVVDFNEEWNMALDGSVNQAEFPDKGPLWKLENIVDRSGERSAWVFCMNHGIDV